MIELRYRNQALPDSFLTGRRYELKTYLNGTCVVPIRWNVKHNDAMVVSGHGSFVDFSPSISGQYVITAVVKGESDTFPSVTQTLTAVTDENTASVRVLWEKTFYADGDNLAAQIVASDSHKIRSSVTWQLLRNNVPVMSGTHLSLKYDSATPGTYRLKGTAAGQDGSELVFDSAVYVFGSVNTRSSLPLPTADGSMVYLGSMFTRQIKREAGVASKFPFQIASTTQDLWFLPGTTHWVAEPVSAEDEDVELPGDVVVRTKAGNWALLGGLTGQEVGYDYKQGMPPIPAPADFRVRLTVDAWVPTDPQAELSWSAFDFRLKVKCYRNVPNVYKYTRCAHSSHPGGHGKRARRFAILFTNLDVQTDQGSGLNRYGTGDAVVAYSTSEVTHVPQMTLSTSGEPHPVPYRSGLFFTDSNSYAIYGSTGNPDLYAKSVASLEGLSPGYFSLLSDINDYTLLNSRVKRVYGNMLVHVIDGSIYAGSTITVKIWKSGSTSFSEFTATVEDTVYANEDATLARVAVIPVDVSDYQFDETGVVFEILVDESAATQGTLPVTTYPVYPERSDDNFYSGTYAPSIVFDGACYSNPEFVRFFDGGLTGQFTVNTGCHDPACGPVGLYCYSPVSTAGTSVHVYQPLGFPAPYLSISSDPTACYQFESFLEESEPETPVAMVTYAGSSICDGQPYIYAKCLADQDVEFLPSQIAVVYPTAASPHSTVSYRNFCYSFSGSVFSSGTVLRVAAADVEPRLSCLDPECFGIVEETGTSTTLLYADIETDLTVPVAYPHWDNGILVSVASQTVDLNAPGVSTGSADVLLNTSRSFLFKSSYVSPAVLFSFGLGTVRKKILIKRWGEEIVYDVGLLKDYIVENIEEFDTVWLLIEDDFGVLPEYLKGATCPVSWSPITHVPRIFKTVSKTITPSSPIKAVGFCGYTDQGTYAYYGTLPAIQTCEGLPNPDSTLTVAANGTEYLLVTSYGSGDYLRDIDENIVPYAGETLSGVVSFKFYARRSNAGAHGDFDIWMEPEHGVENYLEVTPYHTLHFRDGYPQERAAVSTDTTRNAYAALRGDSSHPNHTPSKYISDDGRVVSAAASQGTVYIDGTHYTRYSEDFGLGFDVL